MLASVEVEVARVVSASGGDLEAMQQELVEIPPVVREQGHAVAAALAARAQKEQAVPADAPEQTSPSSAAMARSASSKLTVV